MIDNKYQYKMVDIRGWDDYIILDLMACAQGHIALSDQEDVHNTKNVYEIMIGGQDNTRVAVRYEYLPFIISRGPIKPPVCFQLSHSNCHARIFHIISNVNR